MRRFRPQRLGTASLTLCLTLGLGLCIAAGPGAAEPARQAALLAEHAALHNRLADSPFGEPLLLRTSEAGEGVHNGDVLAVLPQPLGNGDLRVQLEAVALAPDQTSLHITYHQATGLAGRLATRLYLATAGRDKVGFSRSAPGPDGQTRRIGGEHAALERNVMRHCLALLASSAVVDGTPAARRGARLRAWFALTERHATQLHEIDLAGYLAEKAGVAAGPRWAPRCHRAGVGQGRRPGAPLADGHAPQMGRCWGQPSVCPSRSPP